MKTQISPVWSESLLGTLWVAKDPMFLHAASEDSDHIGWMPRLIRVFAGHIGHLVGFVVVDSNVTVKSGSKEKVQVATDALS